MSDVDSLLSGGRSAGDAIEIDSDLDVQGKGLHADVSGASTDGVGGAQDGPRGDRVKNKRTHSQEDLSHAALLLEFASGLPSSPAVDSGAVASSSDDTSPPEAGSCLSPSSPLSSAASSSSSPPDTPTAATKNVRIAPSPAVPDSEVKVAGTRKKLRKSNTGIAVPGFSQKRHVKGGKNGEETFEHHPIDPNIIIARYRVKNPYDDTVYEQVNELREIDTTKTSPDPPQFVLEPDLGIHKVPRRVRKNEKNGQNPALFIEDPATGVWTRAAGDHGPEVVWTACILFRRLDSETGEYLQPYINIKRLEGIDPNDKGWAYAYNKWLDQIKRRRDSKYKQIVLKHHWSHTERAALYDAINAFIAKSGLNAFGSDMAAKYVQVMTDAVNNAGGMGRGVDAVRGQIASSHARKNKAIFELMARAQHMRQRVAKGEKVPHHEQYPVGAIPRAQFPDVKGANGKPRSRKVEKEDDSEDDIEADTDSEDEAEERAPTVPWFITSPPDAAAVLQTKGSGIPPNRPAFDTAWEVEDNEEDWFDAGSEDESLEGGEDEEDGESAWEDMSEEGNGDQEMEDIVDLQEEAAEALDHQAAEAFSRACIPTEDNLQEAPATSPKDQQAEQFARSFTPTQDDDEALSAPVTPSSKRKCVLDDGDGDEMLPSPQRSIKKARGMSVK